MKYIIDIPDEIPVSDELVPFDMCRPSWYLEAYEKGKADAENEAWEFAKTVSIMKPEDKRECWGTDKYNTINLGYSYQEAKAQYDTWRKQKDDKAIKQKVVDLAEEIGVHRLYAIVREIRGE